MEICLIFMLSNGFALGTAECQQQLFVGDGLVTPHEVVYNSHPEECWDGYLFYIPYNRVHVAHHTRYVKYHVVRKRHVNRIRYHGKVHHHKRYKRYKRYKRPRVKYRRHKRLIRMKPRYAPRKRVYNRTVINRHYYGNNSSKNKNHRRGKRKGKKGKNKKF